MRIAIFTPLLHKTVVLHTVSSLGSVQAKIKEITTDKQLLLEVDRYEIPENSTESLREALTAHQNPTKYRTEQSKPSIKKVTILLDPRAVCALELLPAHPQEN